MEGEKEKELIAIIGQLNSEVYDLKHNKGSENTNNTKNMINFVNLGKNSPMTSNSAVEFLEAEKNAMNEAYEAEIQSLKRDLMAERESSKNMIESLQEKINTINTQNTVVQSELVKANAEILHYQKLYEDQRSLNLAYKSMNTNTSQQDNSNTSELLIKFENISKENEELKEKVNDLTKTVHFHELELQKQIQSNNADRENFYAEIKRLTENSMPKIENEVSSSNQDYEIEKSRLTSENSQLRSNLANISLALQKAVTQNTQLSNDLHLVEKKCSDKVRNALEECSQYKAVFTSLQSLFNTENTADILFEVNKLFQNSRKIVDYEHMQMLLKAEIKKNEELRLMVHLGATIPSTDKQQSSSSPHSENQNGNDAFLLQERLAQLEAEKEDLARIVSNSNKNCEDLSHQLSQKDQIIEENQRTIRTLQEEADTLRGEILSHEEQLSQAIKNEKEENSSNQVQTNENEMKELLALVESLREENDELRLTIGRKESGVDTISQNPISTPTQPQIQNQETDYLILSLQAQLSQIQQKVLQVAESLKQVEMPTPTFLSFTEFLEEKVITPSNGEGEMNAFAEEAVAIASQLNFDYRTLFLVQNQCVSAYDQMNKFFADLKQISDKVENFYCSFDSIYESVCNHLNFDQGNLYAAEDAYNGDGNYDFKMGENAIPTTADDFGGNMMQIPEFQDRKSPKVPNGNSSFISLLDSPKIYRNELLDQDNNSDEEIKMNIDDLDEIPSLAIKDKPTKPSYQGRKQNQASSIASSSSRIPKASGAKNSKSRIPLSSRQNAFDQKMLSPRQAPSHIPELPSKRKNKFA